MLPNGERDDELDRRSWSRNGLVSAQAACARNRESEKEYGDFVRAAESLVRQLRHREEQLEKLGKIVEQINLGLTLDEVLNFLFKELREVIPYDRIGVAFIEDGSGLVVADWIRSDRQMALKQGYKAPLAGSSLQIIAETGKPRIINDLEAYFLEHPDSKATQLILREGMKSSLTCPLASKGRPMGFVFFSSVRENAYSQVHVGFFEQIAAQLSVSVEKGRLYSELAEHEAVVEAQNATMTRDLEMARSVQQTLIPQGVVEIRGLDIAFRYEPVIQVGGDMLDILPVSEQKALFFVGDAMGHGVQAALVMCAVTMALHAAVRTDPCPKNVLARVNDVLVRLRMDSFVTAVCCVIDSSELVAELSLAGHAGPLWFRGDKAGSVAQPGGGLPLGVRENAVYASTRIDLQQEDVLLFFTDGITEAFNHAQSQYGMERLQEQLVVCGKSRAEEICATIRNDLTAHCRSVARADDVTLLAIKVAGSRAGTAVSGERH
jgi:serine phosphatase RsbU (regulator of sigma subunit)